MITAQFAAEQGWCSHFPSVDQANSIGVINLLGRVRLVRTVDDIIEETVHLHQTDFLFMDSMPKRLKIKLFQLILNFHRRSREYWRF